MPVGPQRSGPTKFPNIVTTPHGQELGRKSETAYSHAVVHTQPMAARREQLEGLSTHLEGMIQKYGEYAEPHVHKDLAKARKELAGLPESDRFSSLVSMHTNSREAEKRRSRESGKGIGFSILPVSQGD